MINILYCCPGNESDCGKAERIIEKFYREERYSVFREISLFEKHVRAYLSHEHLIILHAESKEHLQQFMAMRDLLIGHRIVLILPDRDKATLAQGHRLRPRFITYLDADFREMASVLYNILHPAASEPATGWEHTSWRSSKKDQI